MKFEWDENKRIANILKHNFDFIDAILVFDDYKRLSIYDNS